MNIFKEYFPKVAGTSRMYGEGDVVTARATYLAQRPQNLRFLLEKRIRWMNDYIPAKAQRVVEIGCGIGVTKEFINHPALVITDFADHPWVEEKVDAQAMPFDASSVDVLLAINCLHHMAYPALFFRECIRVLKPGGKLLIQDATASWIMRLVLRAMRHEGYSFKRDPFDPTVPCNDPANLWSGNNAISDLCFQNVEQFHRHFPQLHIVKQWFSEFMLFPLSGGVTAKSPTVQLPELILKCIDRIDQVLVDLVPGVFAFQRSVVLEKSRTS